jgi:hypothetical protein
MRFYNRQHRHYCRIDLHVKTMYVCIFDTAGQVLVHRNMPSTPTMSPGGDASDARYCGAGSIWCASAASSWRTSGVHTCSNRHQRAGPLVGCGC